MTHSEPQWADPLIQLLAKRLNVDDGVQGQGCPTPVQIYPPSSPDHPVRLSVEAGSHAGVEYKFYALQWSPLTDPFKCMAPLLGDREDGNPIKMSSPCSNPDNLHYPARRALVNGPWIKDYVFNDGFPDVMLYIAPQYWPVFRDAVSAALCYMYSAAPQRPCGPGSNPDPPPTEQYVFITHSLGANVLLDTLCEQIRCGETHPGAPALNQGRGSPDLQRAIRTSFAGSTPIYMLANQYLVLELRKATPLVVSAVTAAEGTSSFIDVRNHPFFKALRSEPRTDKSLGATTAATQPDIDIIAFSDPNDDLSFLLPSLSDGSTGPAITVQNVLVQNAPEYLWLFEDPKAAHLGYYLNPDHARILDVIFCGMTADGVARC